VLLRGKEKLWLLKLGERLLRESLLEGRGELVDRELVGVGVPVGLGSGLQLPLPLPPALEPEGGVRVEEGLGEDLGLDEASQREGLSEGSAETFEQIYGLGVEFYRLLLQRKWLVFMIETFFFFFFFMGIGGLRIIWSLLIELEEGICLK
jgi:hypothetical protein